MAYGGRGRLRHRAACRRVRARRPIRLKRKASSDGDALDDARQSVWRPDARAAIRSGEMKKPVAVLRRGLKPLDYASVQVICPTSQVSKRRLRDSSRYPSV